MAQMGSFECYGDHPNSIEGNATWTNTWIDTWGRPLQILFKINKLKKKSHTIIYDHHYLSTYQFMNVNLIQKYFIFNE